MGSDQTSGIAERVLYGLILGFMMKLVEKGWITSDMAPYYATGVVAFAGGAYAWWINRPGKLLDAGARQLPKNATLVITPAPDATHSEKMEVKNLADSAGPSVVAKAA